MKLRPSDRYVISLTEHEMNVLYLALDYRAQDESVTAAQQITAAAIMRRLSEQS